MVRPGLSKAENTSNMTDSPSMPNATMLAWVPMPPHNPKNQQGATSTAPRLSAGTHPVRCSGNRSLRRARQLEQARPWKSSSSARRPWRISCSNVYSASSPVAPVWLATARLLPRLHRRQSPGAMPGARPKPDPPAAVGRLQCGNQLFPALVPAVPMAVGHLCHLLLQCVGAGLQGACICQGLTCRPRKYTSSSAWCCCQCMAWDVCAPVREPLGGASGNFLHLCQATQRLRIVATCWPGLLGADLPPSLGAHLPVLRGFGQ